MSCLPNAAIAKAATIGDLPPHLMNCLTCRRQYDAERAGRALAQRLVVPTVSSSRRAEIAAEVIARAERDAQAPRPRVRSRVVLATTLAAAAASILLLARSDGLIGTAADLEPLAATEPIALSIRTTAATTAPPVAEPRAPSLAEPIVRASDDARLVRTPGARRDLLAVTNGTLEIDTRASRPVELRIGAQTVRLAKTRASVTVRDRAIVSVRVLVGSAQVTSRGRRATVAHDTVWTPVPSALQQSSIAFRDAWIAMRAEDYARAIELFAQVTDPTFSAEAAHWSAVARQRLAARTR